jgi:hypothetical protein
MIDDCPALLAIDAKEKSETSIKTSRSNDPLDASDERGSRAPSERRAEAAWEVEDILAMVAGSAFP